MLAVKWNDMARNLLTDIAGITVGHATDLALGSGVTAILFDPPAVASVSVLGGAPGGRDTACWRRRSPSRRWMRSCCPAARRSAWMLPAACRRRCASRGGACSPWRAGAAGAAGDHVRPGERRRQGLGPVLALPRAWLRGGAGRRDDEPFALGSVGAGTGATTATVKGGLGSASAVTRAGHTVAAIAAVNAVGSPLIGDGPWFWAAPFEQDGEFGGRGWPADGRYGACG